MFIYTSFILTFYCLWYVITGIKKHFQIKSKLWTPIGLLETGIKVNKLLKINRVYLLTSGIHLMQTLTGFRQDFHGERSQNEFFSNSVAIRHFVHHFHHLYHLWNLDSEPDGEKGTFLPRFAKNGSCHFRSPYSNARRISIYVASYED